MLINTGVHLRDMESSITTRKEELTQETNTIVLDVVDYSAISNVVKSVEGSAAFDQKDIKFVYISSLRVCILFQNGREYSFPIGDIL